MFKNEQTASSGFHFLLKYSLVTSCDDEDGIVLCISRVVAAEFVQTNKNQKAKKSNKTTAKKDFYPLRLLGEFSYQDGEESHLEVVGYNHE